MILHIDERYINLDQITFIDPDWREVNPNEPDLEFVGLNIYFASNQRITLNSQEAERFLAYLDSREALVHRVP